MTDVEAIRRWRKRLDLPGTTWTHARVEDELKTALEYIDGLLSTQGAGALENICLVCGAKQPCMTEADLKPGDPGVPCTFDPACIQRAYKNGFRDGQAAPSPAPAPAPTPQERMDGEAADAFDRALLDRLSTDRAAVFEEAERVCTKLGLQLFGAGELGMSSGAAECVNAIRTLKDKPRETPE